MGEDKLVNQRLVEGSDPGIIPEEITDVLSNSIARIEYKIESSNDNIISTGFFIKLNIKGKLFNFLFTCKHSVGEKEIQSEIEITIYFGKSKKEKNVNIKLDKRQRFIIALKNLDVTVIQILPKDNISKDKYLLPDYNYLSGNSDYKNKQIYIGGYPNVIIHKKEKHYSSGVIRSIIKNYHFLHSADTRAGSSGSPIINSDKKVIGIHNGAYEKLNSGTFISSIINELAEEIDSEKIDDNKPYENNNIEINVKEDNGEIEKGNLMARKDEDKNEDEDEDKDEQPKEDTKVNTFNQNDYINNLINSSSVLSLSQENIAKFGSLINNPNYINYVKNYYSNPIVREGLKNNQDFQNLLKINPAMKMVYEQPEMINKIFTQEMCNDMYNALMNGNNQEINDVNQRVENIIFKESNKNNDDDNNN